MKLETLKTITPIRSTDVGRYAITGTCIRPNVETGTVDAVTTDGRTMARIREQNHDNAIEREAIITDPLRTQPKGADLRVNGDVRFLTASGGESTVEESDDAPDFPDYEAVSAPPGESVSVHLNPFYLAKVVKAVADWHVAKGIKSKKPKRGDWNPHLKLTIPTGSDENGPVRLEAEIDGDSILTLIMPVFER